MRSFAMLLAVPALLVACHPSSPQADALDNAAAQADPAAAAKMRQAAGEIRASGSTANLADPQSPAQQAMDDAGTVAARPGPAMPRKQAFGMSQLVTPGPARPTPETIGATDAAGAKPHRAGAPVPNSTTPTPVTNR